MTWGAVLWVMVARFLERDHGSGIGTDVVLADILRVGAELFVGLHVDAIGAVVEIEIVDVGRTHVDAEGVGDLAERNVEALGLFAVDGDDVLRIVCGVGSEEAGDIFLRTLAGGANEVVGHLVEILEGMSSLIEEFVLEAAELAEALDGGRFEGNDDSTGDSEERTAEAVQDGGGAMFFALTFTVRLERQKHETGVGSGPPKLNRATEKVPNFGISFVMAETCRPMLRVYSSEAPVGAWMATMR